MPNPEEYTIGWICALPTEHTAACLFLDEEHGQPDPDHIAAGDSNAYELGVMAGHKVVIAVLPHGEYATSTAATVATDMLRSFPNVKVGLMVGVGGGAPTTNNDIRLGDVVVSSPKEGKSGVYQYDYGKRLQGHEFKPTGHLNQAPSAVLTAMALLVSRYERKGNRIGLTVDAILEENPRLRKKYGRPEIDNLYASNFVHPDGDDKRDCEALCETKPPNIIARPSREEDVDNPAVHFGTIASGNSLMKDALIRDSLASEGVLCFEMEAAGLTNCFPCLVVRGICDYSDSHKNKRWQGYAAMTAAAYTKDLLKVILPKRVDSEKRLTTILESIDSKTASIQAMLKSTERQQQAQHLRSWLSPSDPLVNLDKALERRHHDTCRWFLEGNEYRSWRTTPSSFFWLHGLSGCGKTVLASTVIHQLQSEGAGGLLTCHYFDINGGDRRGLSQMLRSLLYQLSSKSSKAKQTMQALYDDCDMGAREPTVRQLSEQFTKILDQVAEVTVIVDALDECDSPDDIVSWLKDLYRVDRNSLHLLVTSRKEGVLATAIDKWIKPDQLHAIRNSEVNKDIASYIHKRLFGSKEFKKWKPHKGLRNHVEEAISRRADGMFRLAACQLDDLKSCIDRPRLMEALSALPSTLQGMYARTLNTLQSSNCHREALFMLQYVLWVKRPPLVSEMIDAIAVRLEEDPGFKQENRLFELRDVITQCSSLLTLVLSGRRREIHLAHSSVREYLTSQHLADPFKELLSELHARSTIAKTSMKYMLDVANFHYDLITSSGRSTDDLVAMSSYPVVLSGHSLGSLGISAHRTGMYPIITMDEMVFPFLRAASYWVKHAAVVASADDDIPRLVMQLYEQEHLLRGFPQILGSGIMYEYDNQRYTRYGFMKPDHESEPLIHACYWGLETVAQRLLDSRPHLVGSSNFSCPLYAASFSGHHRIVKMLLAKSAAVDGCIAVSTRVRTIPLHGASKNGHFEVVKTLLQHGARIHLQGFRDETAIELAVRYGHREILQFLVTSCDYIPFHLLFTIMSRITLDDAVVSLLCSKPILPDAQTTSSEFTRLLSDLMGRKKSSYAKLLLEKGPHVPIVSYNSYIDWPAPAKPDDFEVIRMLLDRGMYLGDYLAWCAEQLHTWEVLWTGPGSWT